MIFNGLSEQMSYLIKSCYYSKSVISSSYSVAFFCLLTLCSVFIQAAFEKELDNKEVEKADLSSKVRELIAKNKSLENTSKNQKSSNSEAEVREGGVRVSLRLF